MTVTANYTPLTPQSFLRRNARVYPEKTAVIHGQRRHTYRELYERSCRQANALLKLGLGRGDNVAVFMPNIPEHLEACNGIHMAGAVMVALNYRLSGPEIAYILNHSQARVLLVDEEFLPLVVGIRGQLEYLENIVAIRNGLGQNIQWPEDAHEYEGWISGASTADPMILPEDENDVISINYTSGTTGNPKGVMYTHRSVYINALCNLLEVGMGADSVYLWTLPMFHCNGWCYVWGVTALGATHVCLRALSPRTIIREIMDRGVTHLCGAPIVLKMIVEGAGEEGIAAFSQGLTVSTAATPPSPRIIGQMLALN
ncbi:MAG: AMP-binding protein, partial [Deltaproteobacteria bacterium]|nr:AMP-binding protein [Deltaproteobacteria bacterium]